MYDILNQWIETTYYFILIIYRQTQEINNLPSNSRDVYHKHNMIFRYPFWDKMSYLTTFSPPLILAASKHLNKRLTNNINISDILSKADIQSPNMAFLRITILLVGAALIGISYAETCTSYPKGHTMKKYKGPVSHIISYHIVSLR